MTNVTSGAGSFGYGYRASQPTLVNRVALPYGHYETNSFDALGRLTGTALANSGNAVMNDHAYTLNVGNQRIAQARNGVGYANTVDYKYDAIGQLLTAIGKEAGGTGRLQEQMGYAYDAGGNLKSRTNNALIQTFTVDSLNQLSTINRSGTLTVAGSTTHPATSVTVNSLAASLYTDTTFARAGFAPVDGTNTYTAIANDSYGRLDTNAINVWLPASATYSYDLNGNLTFDGRKAFEYDDENQLVRVTRTNEWKTEFTYDGKMRMRIRKEFTWQSGIWNLQSEIRYVYDGMLVVQERDGNNQPQVSYTRGRDLSGTFEGAGGIGGLLARTSIPEMLNPSSQTLLSTTFYHADGNGNITALMSTNGLIVAWYQYDAYGRTLAQSGPLADANCYRFSSKAWHEKAGLYYYGYRFYTPELQRWVNRDPIGERGGKNLYGYVRNGPIYFVDPFGFTIWKCTRSTSGMPAGRHSYIWDDRESQPIMYARSCGMGTGLTSMPEDQGPIATPISEVMSPPWWAEKLPGVDPQVWVNGDYVCIAIEGSKGREDEIMRHCRKCINQQVKRWLYIPGRNDCHTACDKTLSDLGLESPEMSTWNRRDWWVPVILPPIIWGGR